MGERPETLYTSKLMDNGFVWETFLKYYDNFMLNIFLLKKQFSETFIY